jgi:uncharacterized Fe-S radical SAM superfamily protein PflX
MYDVQFQPYTEEPVKKCGWRLCAHTVFYATATLSCTLCLGFMSIRVYEMAEHLSRLDVDRLNELINRLIPPN